MDGNRKDEHVRHAVAQRHNEISNNDFDHVVFLHHALAGIDCADVALDTGVLASRWRAPLFINAMTGGSAGTGKINRALAIAARETGLPIASGSMSPYLRDRALAHTFDVLRRENPHGYVIANVNANTTAEQARRAVDLLSADALQIHLNAVQEIVMPEGDRKFAHWPEHIQQIVGSSQVPVIVKEVGFGLSRTTVEQLVRMGVSAADVGGRGGTNFARIENQRRRQPDCAFLSDWGQSTAACLLDDNTIAGIELLASGGIRSPLDVVRALALGARAVGVAGRFLEILVSQGTTALVDTIAMWLEQMCQIMALLGVRTPAELARTDLLLTGELETYCRLRGIDAGAYANREPAATASSEWPPQWILPTSRSVSRAGFHQPTDRLLVEETS